MLRPLLSLAAGLSLSAGRVAALPSEPPLHTVASLKITILSTMLADQGMGEWGFSALVDVDGRRILFDTGLRPETVLQNARDLGIDLSTVTDVVLSHHHGDHTGGLLALRRELSKHRPVRRAGDRRKSAEMATRLLTLWQRADAELQSMLGDIRTRVTGFDALFCWGQNGEGQLGNGTTVSSAVPVGSRHGSASAKSPAALTMRVP